MNTELPREIWMQIASRVQYTPDLRSVLRCCKSANELCGDSKLYGLRLVRQRGAAFALKKLAYIGLDSVIDFLLRAGEVTQDDVRRAGMLVGIFKPKRTIAADDFAGHEAVMARGLAASPTQLELDTALWWACFYYGHKPFVEMLLRAGASPFVLFEVTADGSTYEHEHDIDIDIEITSVKTPYTRMAIHNVCLNCYRDILELMIQTIPDFVRLNIPDSYGKNLLWYVCRDRKTTELLLGTAHASQTQSMLMKRDSEGRMPIYRACISGRNVEYLLQLDPDCVIGQLTAIDYERQTPLMTAAEYGRGESARQLLRAAEAIDKSLLVQLLLARDDMDRTALHVAAQEGSIDVLEVLFEYMRDLGVLEDEIVDCSGYVGTPLHIAVQKPRRIQAVRFLLQQARNSPGLWREMMEAEHDDGHTPIYVACKRNNSRAVKALSGSAPNEEERGKLALQLLDQLSILDDSAYDSDSDFDD